MADRIPVQIASRRPKGRRRHVPGRRMFSDSEKSMIAWLAGQGHSAVEIAETISNTTPASIYAHIRRQGISLIPKPATSTAFVVRTKRITFDALVLFATNMNVDPVDLAGRILQAVLSEPVLLQNLMDEGA